jgi:hypothetical protein
MMCLGMWAPCIAEARIARIIFVGTPTECRRPHPTVVEFLRESDSKRAAVFCTCYGANAVSGRGAVQGPTKCDRAQATKQCQNGFIPAHEAAERVSQKIFDTAY